MKLWTCSKSVAVIMGFESSVFGDGNFTSLIDIGGKITLVENDHAY